MWFLRKKESPTEWTIPYRDVEHLEETVLRFILEQAKLLLDDTLEARRSIEAKITAFISVLIPLLMALFSVNFNVIPKPSSEHALAAIHYSTTLLLVSLFLCLLVFVPRKRRQIGSLPNTLYREDWKEEGHSTQIKRYIATEIRSYQVRGEYNLKVGRLNSWLFFCAIFAASTAPVAFTIAWIMDSICQSISL